MLPQSKEVPHGGILLQYLLLQRQFISCRKIFSVLYGANGVYNLTRDWVNDAVNAPPYNGRSIFEIEHGLTAPATKADKSGNGYTDGTDYC
ncbi:TPA: hypothetical protein ACE75G_000431 [Neisseria gonorrhoeae]